MSIKLKFPKRTFDGYFRSHSFEQLSYGFSRTGNVVEIYPKELKQKSLLSIELSENSEEANVLSLKKNTSHAVVGRILTVNDLDSILRRNNKYINKINAVQEKTNKKVRLRELQETQGHKKEERLPKLFPLENDASHGYAPGKSLCPNCGGDGGAKGQCYKCGGSGWA